MNVRQALDEILDIINMNVEDEKERIRSVLEDLAEDQYAYGFEYGSRNEE